MEKEELEFFIEICYYLSEQSFQEVFLLLLLFRRRRKAAPVSIITENDSVSDSEFSNVDNSAFRNENSQVAPSVDDDDQSTTKEASAAGSGKDASHQDRVPEN